MSERISVTITAQDGASRTFTAIGNSAQKMGDQIESAGKEGTASLKTIDTQAQSTGRSMDSIRNNAIALGAAFGTLVSAAALLGNAYRDQERQIDGINRLYGEQADEILAVSEQIQEMTRFSNDAARESFLLASSLVTNYGLSADQMQVLVERSADLAQIHGFTLPDAMTRTAAALRGEGEAAERLGLNMSDAAIAAAALDAGITNWNVPGALTEAEKAAFRFQVFLEQTATASGAAADAADSAGGRFRQFANEMQDAGQAIGGFLGPVGQVAAEFAPILIALPIAGAGLGRLGAAFTSTAAGARAAALGIGALRLALGPVGLLLSGIVAIGGSLFTSWMNQKQAAEDYNTALENLLLTGERLRRQGDEQLADRAEAAQAAAAAIREAFEATQPSSETPPGEDPLEYFDSYNERIIEFNRNLGTISRNITDITNNITDAISDPLIDADAYLGFVNRLLTAASIMPGTMDDLYITTGLANLELSHFSTAANGAADGLGDFSAASAEASDAIDTLNTFLGTFVRTDVERGLSGIAEGADALAQAAADAATDIVAFQDATQEWLANGDNILDFWLQYQENLRETATAYGEAKQAALEMGESIGEAPNLADMADDAFISIVAMADALDDAGEELDSVLNTFRQIDDLGQRSAAAGSIADNLIGPPGELGTVQDLWSRIQAGTADAALTADQYNQAIASGTSIQQTNLRIQDDLTAMRAQQLPLLESELLAYEAQIEAISQLPPLEQRRALAMQDSAVQAQIASQFSTAYAASLGEIPEDVATNMIVSAAEADPVLKDLLIQMELIEVDREGNISVNFPDGPTVQESITELTRSIDALIVAMGGVPPLRIDLEDNASEGIQAVHDRMVGLDGQTATTSSTHQDNASNPILNVGKNLGALNGLVATTTSNTVDNSSGVLDNVRSKLIGLDGKTATSFVRTVYQTIGSPSPAFNAAFRRGGGIIEGYADGGVLFHGAEAGPELLHYATGGTAPIFHDGLYTAPAGTYVSPANANPGMSNTYGGATFNVSFNGSGNRDEMNRWASEEFIPLVQREMNRHERSQGYTP